MKNQRQEAIRIISEDQLNKLDEAGLVIVSRDERDQIISKLSSPAKAIPEPKDKEPSLNDELSKVLGVTQEHFLSKIRQLQVALRPFASLSNRVPPDYAHVLNARIALGEKVDIPVKNPNVIPARRDSVYIPPARSIATKKDITIVRQPSTPKVVKPKIARA
jgi:hypothetical protein